jgi:hypothetical protein
VGRVKHQREQRPMIQSACIPSHTLPWYSCALLWGRKGERAPQALRDGRNYLADSFLSLFDRVLDDEPRNSELILPYRQQWRNGREKRRSWMAALRHRHGALLTLVGPGGTARDGGEALRRRCGALEASMGEAS